MQSKYIGMLAAVWGFGGAFSLIAFAVWRLTPYGIEAPGHFMSTLQWFFYIASIAYMLYAEGYRGFQCGFSPRAAARTLYLTKNPSALRLALAPLFVMGYFDATRKRIITTYLLTTMIIGLVLVVRLLEQPWRGIVDAGVVAGLIYGLGSMLYFLAQVLTTDTRYSPEVPAEH